MIDGELLGLFLSFIYPILGAEEVITSETPVSADKKKKKKRCSRSLHSLAKVPGKEQPHKTENFQSIITLLQPHPHPSSRSSGKSRLYPSYAIMCQDECTLSENAG